MSKSRCFSKFECEIPEVPDTAAGGGVDDALPDIIDVVGEIK